MPSALQKNYGIVLLAAGKSSRLGESKQLLILEGASLVKRAALIAAEVSKNIVVVTGAQEDKIREEVSSLPVHVAFNKDYEEGMASSIRVGLTTLQRNFPEIHGTLFIVCDQPYISAALLKQMIATAEQGGKGIVACTYGGTFGTPVLFQKKYFSLLLQLTGDQGAKRIIQNNPDDLATIEFPEGSIDIDTIQDYEALKKST